MSNEGMCDERVGHTLGLHAAASLSVHTTVAVGNVEQGTAVTSLHERYLQH